MNFALMEKILVPFSDVPVLSVPGFGTRFTGIFLVSDTRYRPPKNSTKYRQLLSEYLLPGIADILVSTVQYWA